MNEESGDSQVKNITSALVRSSERMIRLISDILNITKIQSDSKQLVLKESVKISEIFETILNDLEKDIKSKHLTVSVVIDADLPKFSSDVSALHEIISNLITNAVQYTPPSGTITLKATSTNDAICIIVQDTGIGIPQESLSKIYDQFSRADNAFAMFNEGTGLGLYLVKLLVQRVGGTIECRSKLNKGTVFKVTIPL